MENLDLIILTSVISVLFLVFILATYREFTIMGKNDFKGGKERGPRADFLYFIGKLFTDDRIDKKQRIQLLDIVKETIAKMETDEMRHGDENK